MSFVVLVVQVKKVTLGGYQLSEARAAGLSIASGSITARSGTFYWAHDALDVRADTGTWPWSFVREVGPGEREVR